MWIVALALAACVTEWLAEPVWAAEPTADFRFDTPALASSALGYADPRYHARTGRGGVVLDNPEQAYQAAFGEAGLVVSMDDQVWRMSLDAYGYGDDLHAVATGRPVTSANRVEIDRGQLTEWYFNGPHGLEQGFTLAAPPSGQRSLGPLTLRLAHTAVTATPDPDARGMTFSLSDGRHLRYVGLTAIDAVGRILPAHLSVAPDRAVVIAVDDHSAVYPVVIDPFIQHAKLISPSPAADDSYGASVAVGDDVVVVGVPRTYRDTVGAAYVYTRTVDSWQVGGSPIAMLMASDGVPGNGIDPIGDDFGATIAVDGDIIIVGAPYADITPTGISTPTVDAGVVYVFVKPVGGWQDSTETVKLQASDAQLQAMMTLGEAIDISGNTVVAGATGFEADPEAMEAAVGGGVFIFEPAGDWSSAPALSVETAILTGDPLENGARFGDGVAINGDVIVVGAPLQASGEEAAAGRVFVFAKDAAWSTTAVATQLTPTIQAAGDWFGLAVDIAGDHVLVGAPRVNDIGAAYLFEKPQLGWAGNPVSETAIFTPSNGVPGDNFGWSVALDANTALVGDNRDLFNVDTDPTAAYRFRKPASGWASATETEQLVATDGVDSDRFGFAVALHNNLYVVGAPDATIGLETLAGAAYAFAPDALVITKQVMPNPVLPGQAITFTLTITNLSPQIAAGVVVSDIIPPDIVQLSVDSSVTITPHVGITYTWDVQDLAASATGVITVTGRVTTPLPGGTYQNLATVQAPTDGTLANNSAQVTYTVPLNADLAVTKTTTLTEGKPGDAITFVITYTNLGPDSATGVVITDTIPGGVTGFSWSSSGITVTERGGAPYIWDVEDGLLSGSGGVFTVTGALTTPVTPTTYTNTVTIASALPDITAGNNRGQAGFAICLPATLVTSTADSGVGTLRAMLAGTCPGGTITFDPSILPATITLTGGELAADRDVTILGPGRTQVTVSGDDASRVFSVAASKSVTISGMTIAHGNAGFGDGGGVLINPGATVVLSGTTILTNTATNGGGIANRGALTLVNGHLAGNTASDHGGGLDNTNSAVVTNAGFSDNTADGVIGGGGIYNSGELTVTNNTFSGNRGSALAQNSGVSRIIHATIADNAGVEAAAIYGLAGSAFFTNTILANNPSTWMSGTTVTNGGGNICWPAATCIGYPTFANADPLLGSLGDYGGYARTLPLLPGSAAIETAMSDGCPAEDSRGTPRPQGATCDSGAFETRPFTLAVVSGDGQQASIQTQFANGLAVSVTGVDPVAGGKLTFAGPSSGASTDPITNTATVINDAAIYSPTANATLGSYSVTVTSMGATAPVSFTLTNIDVPVAGLSASNDSPKQINQTIQFSAVITAGTNVTYTWTFGDGATGNGADPTHAYAAKGTYTATVTATNGASSDNATTTVEITDISIAALSAVNNGPKQIGQSVQFSATAIGSGITYTWDFGDGATGSGANQTHAYAAKGTYTATVTATNDTGSVYATTEVQVIDIPIFGLTAANNGPKQIGQNVQLNASIAAGSNVLYTWDFGDGATGNGADPTHAYAAKGTYTAKVTATNGAGSVDANITVTITDVPIAGLTATNDGPMLVGGPTQFNAAVTVGSNVVYVWDFGDGKTGSGTNPTHTYAAAGTYTAKVTATNDAGNITAQTEVTITPNAILSVQIDGSGNGSVNKDPDATEYVPGTVVKLVAVPASGSYFTGWSGAISGTTTPIDIAMDANKTITATFVDALVPQAFNDAAATLQGSTIGGNVLANDVDPEKTPLTVIASTAPAHGTATVAPNGHFIYTPDAEFVGIDIFEYTVQNGYAKSDSAQVIVHVNVGEPPTVVTSDPEEDSVQRFLVNGLPFTLTIPAGAYQGAIPDGDVFSVLFTPLAALDHTNAAPNGYKFAGVAFRLEAFINATRLENPAFAPPLMLTITYDPDLRGDADAATLDLRFWNSAGNDWSSDGITVLDRDAANNRITFAIHHLSDFALFVEREKYRIFVVQIFGRTE